MTAPKSHDASARAGTASEAAGAQVHDATCSCASGYPLTPGTLGYSLSTENVDEDGDTLVWPPVFFGEVVRVAPYPADQQLPDPRVASAMAATVRQTPTRLPR